MSEKPNLTKRHFSALRECAEWQAKNRAYWWRQKSMHDLEAHGLVAGNATNFSKSIRAFRVTPEGLRSLKAEMEGIPS